MRHESHDYQANQNGNNGNHRQPQYLPPTPWRILARNPGDNDRLEAQLLHLRRNILQGTSLLDVRHWIRGRWVRKWLGRKRQIAGSWITDSSLLVYDVEPTVPETQKFRIEFSQLRTFFSLTLYSA